jgi:hypothetical protein
MEPRELGSSKHWDRIIVASRNQVFKQHWRQGFKAARPQGNLGPWYRYSLEAMSLGVKQCWNQGIDSSRGHGPVDRT